MSGRGISYKGQHIKVDDRNVDDVESRTQEDLTLVLKFLSILYKKAT